MFPIMRNAAAHPARYVAGALCLSIAVATMTSATAAVRHPREQRGTLVSVTGLLGLNAGQADGYVHSMGFTAPAGEYGVDVYRITYRTVDATGRPTVASGVVTLPRTNRRRALPTVEYTHGTLPFRGDAASVSDGSDRAITVLFAERGFATAAPDYLGLGSGPGPHPYLDTDSETTASVDMLKAARTAATWKGTSLDGRVLATGFSQGGVAAMGLGRALQQGAAPGFRLTALAPVSGPYDLAGAELPAAFDGRLSPPVATVYLAYAITAWNRLHPLYSKPSEAFLPPYDSTVEALFDGDHTDEQILAGLPASPYELLTPAFVEQLKHPTGALARLLHTADAGCSNWTPKVPVRLYAADGDRDVAVANTRSCQQDLQADGVDAGLVNVGDVDHNTSALLSYPKILQWFRALTA